MKKLHVQFKVNWIVLAILLMLFTSGCATTGGFASSFSKIDWNKTSQYYHEYISEVAVPLGGMVAVMAAPAVAPEVALAIKESRKLDQLLKAKASGATLYEQSLRVQNMIQAINNNK
jgi:hypothetical protein